eukprot:TRINITY_DN10992_c0_g1_i1.p1 TRINITY_DN10992_c0_g1~~TRINITY_DN10992_c0_g1_i1.p1  ORF type:complete len:377 (-),score=68.09 TRINITY_DN10992_c0_g1_i1:47-1144(-)
MSEAVGAASLSRRRCSLAERPVEVLQAHAEESGLLASGGKHELVERIMMLEGLPAPLRRQEGVSGLTARRRCSLAGRPLEVLRAHAEECGVEGTDRLQKLELVEEIITAEPGASFLTASASNSRVSRLQSSSQAYQTSSEDARGVSSLTARRRCSLAERPLEVLRAHAEECGVEGTDRLQKHELVEEIITAEPGVSSPTASASHSSTSRQQSSSPASRIFSEDARLAQRLQAEELQAEQAMSPPAPRDTSGTPRRRAMRRRAESEPYPLPRRPQRAFGRAAAHAHPASPLQRIEASTARIVCREAPIRSGAEDESAGECSVCMEGFVQGQELRVLPCLHRFHRSCIDRWILQRPTCPLCQHELNS